jgi:hypothetical protein
MFNNSSHAGVPTFQYIIAEITQHIQTLYQRLIISQKLEKFAKNLQVL